MLSRGAVLSRPSDGHYTTHHTTWQASYGPNCTQKDAMRPRMTSNDKEDAACLVN